MKTRHLYTWLTICAVFLIAVTGLSVATSAFSHFLAGGDYIIRRNRVVHTGQPFSNGIKQIRMVTLLDLPENVFIKQSKANENNAVSPRNGNIRKSMINVRGFLASAKGFRADTEGIKFVKLWKFSRPTYKLYGSPSLQNHGGGSSLIPVSKPDCDVHYVSFWAANNRSEHGAHIDSADYPRTLSRDDGIGIVTSSVGGVLCGPRACIGDSHLLLHLSPLLSHVIALLPHRNKLGYSSGSDDQGKEGNPPIGRRAFNAFAAAIFAPLLVDYAGRLIDGGRRARGFLLAAFGVSWFAVAIFLAWATNFRVTWNWWL